MNILSFRTGVLTACAVIALASTAVLAQLTNTNQESLQIPIGQIFEMQAAAPSNASVSWVLSEGNTFVEAGRDHIFRTRFSREGNYTLVAQVDEQSAKVVRTFSIQVRQRNAEDTTVPANSTDAVSVEPAMANNIIPISSSHQVALFTPERKDINILAIDFDTTVDTNGDGNPQNDENTQGTLFRSDGNPLYVWFPEAKRTTIRLGALFTDGTTQFHIIGIGGPAASAGQSSSSQGIAMMDDQKEAQIMVLKNDNGEVQFALRMPQSHEDKPLLLYWEFGDGHSQMLDRPIHTYSDNGTYTVTVTIRELQTGNVVQTVTDSIVINRLAEDTPDTPVQQPTSSTGGSIIGLVLKLLLTLVVSVIVGGLIFFVIGKVKQKGFSLEKTLEKAEQTMVKTPEETVRTDAPPMEIVAEEVPEPTPPEPTPEPPPAPAPSPEPTPPPVQATQVEPETPSWLSEAMPPQQTPEPSPIPEPVPVPAPAPAPVPEPQVEPPAENVSHTPMAPSAEQLQADTTNAPDWLQAGIEQAEQKGETVTTPPAEPAPVPEPTVEPIAEPVAPAPTSQDTEREERERERKRRKRQRYRENLKKRKEDGQQEQTSDVPSDAEITDETPSNDNPDEPIAFITAEEIPPATPEDMPPPPPPAESA